jgi:hypothetical protein
MCFPHPEPDWEFDYATDCLLPKDQDGEPCLLVVRHGNSTSTTLGRQRGLLGRTQVQSQGRGRRGDLA